MSNRTTCKVVTVPEISLNLSRLQFHLRLCVSWTWPVEGKFLHQKKRDEVEDRSGAR